MIQNVIASLDAEGTGMDSNPNQTTGTLRALSLIFAHVSAPAELQPKLASLLEKAKAHTLMNQKDGTSRWQRASYAFYRFILKSWRHLIQAEVPPRCSYGTRFKQIYKTDTCCSLRNWQTRNRWISSVLFCDISYNFFLRLLNFIFCDSENFRKNSLTIRA